MRINKHDTNGTKPLLGKGELGYDDYTAGGDTGRVYVGNGASNIALAKKSEVDAKVVANAGITAGTATKVTYDAKGLVTSGTNPTTLSGYGITDTYTKTETNTQISTAVNGLVDAAPGTLDTLNELAAALGDDPNFATTTANAIAAKVPKVTSTDNAIVRFNGTTGNVQNSGVTIDDNNNVGIGVTPSAWRTTQKVLELPGGACLSNFNSLDNINISSNIYINNSNQYIYKNNGYATMYSQSATHQWNIAPSGTAGNPIAWTSAMTLWSNGNLLVGTTTDNGVDKLQVNGSMSSGAIQSYSSGDLNNFKYITQTIGTYPSAYISNTPINDHGYLEIIVYSPNTYVMQRFTTLGAFQTAGRVFVRCLTNSTWSAWAEK